MYFCVRIQMDQCEKAFSQSITFIIHQKIHTAEKPYACDNCEMDFLHKNTLAGHKKIYTEEKPYKCEISEKTFSVSSFLVYNKKITHEKSQIHVIYVIKLLPIKVPYMFIRRFIPDKKKFTVKYVWNYFNKH